MKKMSMTAILLCLAACSGLSNATQPTGALVVSWNEELLAIAEAEDRFLTLKGLRTAAMMHLAVHDSLNAIDSRYSTWLEVDAAPDADPTAAAAQAAFEVARSQYPDQEQRLRFLLQRSLTTVPDGAPKTLGIELGEERAQAILAAREADGWNSEAEYEWHPMSPGVYAEFREHSGTPEGFVFGSGWAIAKPFAIDSPSQFRSPPPPAIQSERYTRAFGEVKETGSADSVARTPDQSHLAMWWKDFVENSHNRLARQLTREERLDAWTATRMFALLNISIYDAYINVFDNKFHYNHWRPYTAIRWAANDGNPNTIEDPEWNNLHGHTYAFPSYPSAHGAACGAATTVLSETFGTDRSITMTTNRVDRAGPLSEKIPIEPPTRSFENFASAAEECSLSRVYLGIHFRYDSTEGTKLGREVGSHVVNNVLEPLDDR